MSLVNPDHESESIKPPLKRSKTGMEIEFHLIDNKGRISHQGHEIVKLLKEKGDKFVTKECGQNMVEFGCYPDVDAHNPVLDIISSIRRAVDVCKEKGLSFYPFATYPGKFTPKLSVGEKYTIQEKIYGRKKMEIACRIVGFHHHYGLPKSVFDAEKKHLRLLRKSKLSRALMGAYNFEIAADPVLTLFTQSSPFYQGETLAKDSRTVVYRGGDKLDYSEGVYSNLQQIGGLPPYKQTVTDLITSLRKRRERWEKEITKADPKADINKLYPYPLDIAWNPIKINKHGTIEQRGMSANYLSVLASMTVLIKYCLRKIQGEFLEVVPADFAIDEPFKIENGILYVPPHTYVRDHLQRESAYDGFANQDMYNYTKKFMSFAQSVTPKRYNAVIKPVKEMIDSKKSTSDRILAYAKRKGYLQDGKINNDDAAELALHYSQQLPKDLEKTEKVLKRVASL